MASEAPTWADQWGEGGFGAMDDAKPKEKTESKKKKTVIFAGIGKAKAAAMVGIKWVKQRCVKQNPPPK